MTSDRLTPGCLCPRIWHGVLPPPCPLHNPSPRTYTTTGTGRPTMTSNPLTEAERKVLRLLAAGYTDEGIARRLGIHVNTVRARVRVISEKWGIAPKQDLNRRVRLAVTAALRERVPLAADLGRAVGAREAHDD